MKISVIVPVYNVKNYLSRCLASIVEQSYKDLEIIVVNDGSTDGSEEICREFRDRDSRIVLIEKENGGLSSARNRGLEIATGKYISFIDADDYIEKNFYEILIQNIEKSQADMIACGIFRVFENGKKSPMEKENAILEGGEAIAGLLNRRTANIMPFPWDKLFRRDIISDIRFDESLVFGEDTPFVYSVLKKVTKYQSVSYCGYNYYKRPGSLTDGDFNPTKLLAVKAANIILKDCELRGLYVDDAKIHKYYKMTSCFSRLVSVRKQYPEEYRMLRKELKNFDSFFILKNIGLYQYIKYHFILMFPDVFAKMYFVVRVMREKIRGQV